MLAALLKLHLKDPESAADYTTLSSLPKAGNRPAIQDGGVTYPAIFGEQGTFLATGMVLEQLTVSNNVSQFACDVILSLARAFTDPGSPEVERQKLSNLANRWFDFIYKGLTAPIYSFGPTINATGVIGRMNWNYKVHGDHAPMESAVGRAEVGGWRRLEYRFRVHWQRN